MISKLKFIVPQGLTCLLLDAQEAKKIFEFVALGWLSQTRKLKR